MTLLALTGYREHARLNGKELNNDTDDSFFVDEPIFFFRFEAKKHSRKS